MSAAEAQELAESRVLIMPLTPQLHLAADLELARQSSGVMSRAREGAEGLGESPLLLLLQCLLSRA